MDSEGKFHLCSHLKFFVIDTILLSDVFPAVHRHYLQVADNDTMMMTIVVVMAIIITPIKIIITIINIIITIINMMIVIIIYSPSSYHPPPSSPLHRLHRRLPRRKGQPGSNEIFMNCDDQDVDRCKL